MIQANTACPSEDTRKTNGPKHYVDNERVPSSENIENEAQNLSIDEDRVLWDAAEDSESSSQSMKKGRSEGLQEGLERKLDAAAKKKIDGILSEINFLSDVEKMLLYLKLPTGNTHYKESQSHSSNRDQQMRAVTWIRSHLIEDSTICLQKQDVYEDYKTYCEAHKQKYLGHGDFGKVMKQVFPNVKPRRLGQRGQSKHCYGGLKKNTAVDSPQLPSLEKTENKPTNTNADQLDELTLSSCTLVCEWARKLLREDFTHVQNLATYLVNNSLVNTRSRAAFTVLARANSVTSNDPKKSSLETKTTAVLPKLAKSLSLNCSTAGSLTMNNDTPVDMSTNQAENSALNNTSSSSTLLNGMQSSVSAPTTPVKGSIDFSRKIHPGTKQRLASKIRESGLIRDQQLKVEQQQSELREAQQPTTSLMINGPTRVMSNGPTATGMVSTSLNAGNGATTVGDASGGIVSTVLPKQQLIQPKEEPACTLYSSAVTTTSNTTTAVAVQPQPQQSATIINPQQQQLVFLSPPQPTNTGQQQQYYLVSPIAQQTKTQQVQTQTGSQLLVSTPSQLSGNAATAIRPVGNNLQAVVVNHSTGVPASTPQIATATNQIGVVAGTTPQVANTAGAVGNMVLVGGVLTQVKAEDKSQQVVIGAQNQPLQGLQTTPAVSNNQTSQLAQLINQPSPVSNTALLKNALLSGPNAGVVNSPGTSPIQQVLAGQQQTGPLLLPAQTSASSLKRDNKKNKTVSSLLKEARGIGPQAPPDLSNLTNKPPGDPTPVSQLLRCRRDKLPAGNVQQQQQGASFIGSIVGGNSSQQTSPIGFSSSVGVNSGVLKQSGSAPTLQQLVTGNTGIVPEQRGFAGHGLSIPENQSNSRAQQSNLPDLSRVEGNTFNACHIALERFQQQQRQQQGGNSSRQRARHRSASAVGSVPRASLQQQMVAMRLRANSQTTGTLLHQALSGANVEASAGGTGYQSANSQESLNTKGLATENTSNAWSKMLNENLLKILSKSGNEHLMQQLGEVIATSMPGNQPKNTAGPVSNQSSRPMPQQSMSMPSTPLLSTDSIDFAAALAAQAEINRQQQQADTYSQSALMTALSQSPQSQPASIDGFPQHQSTGSTPTSMLSPAGSIPSRSCNPSPASINVEPPNAFMPISQQSMNDGSMLQQQNAIDNIVRPTAQRQAVQQQTPPAPTPPRQKQYPLLSAVMMEADNDASTSSSFMSRVASTDNQAGDECSSTTTMGSVGMQPKRQDNFAPASSIRPVKRGARGGKGASKRMRHHSAQSALAPAGRRSMAELLSLPKYQLTNQQPEQQQTNPLDTQSMLSNRLLAHQNGLSLASPNNSTLVDGAGGATPGIMQQLQAQFSIAGPVPNTEQQPYSPEVNDIMSGGDPQMGNCVMSNNAALRSQSVPVPEQLRGLDNADLLPSSEQLMEGKNDDLENLLTSDLNDLLNSTSTALPASMPQLNDITLQQQLQQQQPMFLGANNNNNTISVTSGGSFVSGTGAGNARRNITSLLDEKPDLTVALQMQQNQQLSLHPQQQALYSEQQHQSSMGALGSPPQSPLVYGPVNQLSDSNVNNAPNSHNINTMKQLLQATGTATQQQEVYMSYNATPSTNDSVMMGDNSTALNFNLFNGLR